MASAAPLHRPSASLWFPLALMLAVLIMRVLAQQGVLPNMNFSPLMALAFVGSIVVPRPLPWWSWAMILLGLDVLSQGAVVWDPENLPVIALTYGCYILAAWFGSRLRRAHAGLVSIVAGSVVCSILFYIITNTFCWAVEPIHAKTASGWLQCLVWGTPGLPPTWLFFRNSLIADLTGTCVLLVAYNGEAFLRGLRALPWVRDRDQSLATARSHA